MGLLDRFRPQPRWKHADPAVRAAAVEEIPLDNQDLIVSIATTDLAPAVRLAAIRKVLNPGVLAECARTDSALEVREGAAHALIETAAGAFEGTSPAECEAALAALSDARHIGAVAKTAGSEAIRRRALDRIDDVRVLGSVARRAESPEIRLKALSRVTDAAELAAIALRSDFKDVSTAAVERLTSRDHLAAVAERGKSKAAAKRAKSRLREIDEAAGPKREHAAVEPRSAASGQPSVATSATRAAAICAGLEASARARDHGALGSRLDAATTAWQAIDGAIDEALERRYEAALAAARGVLARDEVERAAAEARARAVSEGLAAREALCAQAETIDGDDTPGLLTAVRTAWASLAAMPEGSSASEAPLARRFEAACAAAHSRHAARAERARREAEAADLVRQFETLASGADLKGVRGRWASLKRAFALLAAAGVVDETMAVRVAAAEASLEAAEKAVRERRERQLQENLARGERLCQQAETLAASEALTLKDAEHVLREVRASVEEPIPLPTRQDRERIEARLLAAQAALTPRLREMRELDEWKRWANAGLQEELCQKAEALKDGAADNPAETARQLAALQAKWKEVAEAPRDRSQELWRRFRAAVDDVRARCDTFFAQQTQERAANLARKEALCQQVEAVADSTDWLRTADEVKRLQAEWKAVGPVSRGQEKAVWERFRAACDRFFTRRQEDLARRKDEWASNLTRKVALCERAEQLAVSSEWDHAAAELKRLQAEWKTIGPVRKKKSEAVWQRFRAACDGFFERYQHRNLVQVTALVSEREAPVSELEGLLAPVEGSEPSLPADLVGRVRSAYDRWQQAVTRGGVPRPQAEAIDARLMAALGLLAQRAAEEFHGTEFDVDENRGRLERLCERVEALGASMDSSGAAAPSADSASVTLLAQQLREALATNTMTGRAPGDGAAKWRQIADEVRKAQAAWKRVGPVPPEVAGPLADRFERACRRAMQPRDQAGSAATGRRR